VVPAREAKLQQAEQGLLDHARVVDQHKPGIERGLRGLITNPTGLAERLVKAPAEKVPRLVAGALTDSDPEPLLALYRAAWAVGAAAARRAAGVVAKVAPYEPPEQPPPPPVAAVQPIPEGVVPVDLAALLEQGAVTWQAIADTVGDQLADRVVDMLTLEPSVRDVAKAISDITESPAKAELIAVTETTRGMTAATYSIYRDLDVANVEFLATDDGKVCPLCIANEDQGPIPIDAEFEHGAPPVHPRCRCALLPALESLEG
jgi:SPP1 gp7 family putative phage head morphogenesis protein